MKKRIISILLCFVLLMVTMVVQVSVSADVDLWDGAAVSSALAGTGTEEDPFIIATAADFACFSNESRGGNSYKAKYVKLNGDISLGNLTFNPLGAFSGTFDGNGHKISGISINTTSDNTGFFSGVIDGTLKDLTLAGSITSTGAFVGGFAGYVVSTNFVNCVNNLDVTGRAKVGGFCGGVNSGDYTNIISCTNNGDITATNTSDYSFLGGFIGAIVSICTVNITGSQNTGHIYSQQRNVVAGFVGQNLGTLTVENCINSGTVTGATQIGGIVANVNNDAVSLTVKNTINVGKLTTIRTTGATAHIGAILGYYAEKANSETFENAFYRNSDYDFNGANDGQTANTPRGTAMDTASDWTDGTIVALLNGDAEEPVFEQGAEYPVLKAKNTANGGEDENVRVIRKFTFENNPGTVDNYNANPTVYQSDGYLSTGTNIISFLFNYGAWTGSTDLTPKPEYANNSGYGVGYTARLGSAFTKFNYSEISPNKFYKMSLDAKVIDEEPDITVQIGLFRKVADGDLAFRDDQNNTFDSAIRTVSLTLDKLTDFNTYTVALSGAEIMAFYESYEFQSGGLFFGVLCTSAILNEKYRNKFGLAMDNFTIIETDIPDDYVPAADLPGVDILEYNLTECFGENLYNIIENSSFEDEIPESWGTLPDGATVKTASAGEEIYGEKYLNLDAENGAVRLVMPFKLTVNKNYVFGISTRADAEDQFRVFVSASPTGSPLMDVDFAEQQFVVAPKDEDGSIKRQGIRIRNTMKSNVQQYLIFEVTKGSVDFDEITLTDKTVSDINKNYYEKKGTEIITVFDLSTLTEKKVEIPAGKTVYDVIK